MMEQQNNMNDYIGSQPAGMQERLQALCDTVHKAAPNAEQGLSENGASFTQNGRQVCVCANASGIQFRTGADTLAAFAPKLAHYACETGAIQFPNGEPLPLNLIEELVSYDVTHE